MTQNKRPITAGNLDEVKFRNGVWVIVEKTDPKRYGFAHGPFATKKLANEAARRGGAKEAA